MAVVVKAMPTASKHNILVESLLILEQFGIMDTQAIDDVIFDFKGTHVRCFVSGSTDYQRNFS